jgi:hypothetical protein
VKTAKLLAIVAVVVGLVYFAWKYIQKAMVKADVAAGKRINPYAKQEIAAGKLGTAEDLAAEFGLTENEAMQVIAAYALGNVDGTVDGLYEDVRNYRATYGSLRKLDGTLGYGAG